MAGMPKDARQPYSVEQIDRIVTAVGLPVDAAKRADLHGKLNTAVSDYLSSTDDPTPAQVRDRLAAIEKATQELLSAFGKVRDTGLPTPSVKALDMPVADARRPLPHRRGSVPNGGPSWTNLPFPAGAATIPCRRAVVGQG